MAERDAKDKRARIIAAAYRVLAEKGYEGATVKEIARAAGVAPGLVHYYFAGKDELLVAMLQEESQRYSAAMQRLAASVPAEDLTRLAMAEPERRTLEQPEWYRLRYALFALALHNPTLAPAVRRLLAGGRAGIATLVSKALGEQASNPDAVAAVLLAAFDGLALQKIVDPAFDLEGAYRVLIRMIEDLGRG